MCIPSCGLELLAPCHHCTADPDAPGACLQAGRVTLQALAVAGLLGTVVALALIWGAEPALSALGADASSGPLHDLSLDYLRIRCSTVPQKRSLNARHAAERLCAFLLQRSRCCCNAAGQQQRQRR